MKYFRGDHTNRINVLIEIVSLSNSKYKSHYDLPEEILEHYDCVRYRDLIKILIVRDYKAMKKRKNIDIGPGIFIRKYKTTPRTVRHILENFTDHYRK